MVPVDWSHKGKLPFEHLPVSGLGSGSLQESEPSSGGDWTLGGHCPAWQGAQTLGGWQGGSAGRGAGGIMIGLGPGPQKIPAGNVIDAVSGMPAPRIVVGMPSGM